MEPNASEITNRAKQAKTEHTTTAHPQLISVATIMKMGRSEAANFLKNELAKEKLGGESLEANHFSMASSVGGQSSASSPAEERSFRSMEFPRFHSSSASYAESNEGIVEENDEDEDQDHRFMNEHVEDATAVLIMDTAASGHQDGDIDLDDLMTAEQQQQQQQQNQFDQKTSGTYYLNLVLDELLNPNEQIDDVDTIKWCRRLIEGGRKSEEFAAIVRSFDNNAKCGLVWIPHVVAYRCRTCGISPCMSICRDCFKKGNHETHDFNMFLSQAGGACDCGDTSVMKADGFCSDHGLHNCGNKGPVPKDLMLLAEAMMPRLLLRLLQHFRDSDYYNYETAAARCHDYCNMLMAFNSMGELMRKVMTSSLIDPELYSKLVGPPYANTKYGRYLELSQRKYEDALKNFPAMEPPDDYKHIPALGQKMKHSTLLEEFIFWTFKFEFPQNIVCFLLNMLPDQDYKEFLTRTFVMHYSRIPTVLELSRDPDTLSNRVVHMSVQLFSNESLALKMVKELNLLHVMIISLKLMMSKILIKNTLHDPEKNFHFVIDCAKRVMKEHCYWPLVSDFNNVLSHESVALVFLRDDELIEMWFQFLSMLQGMNVNIRETGNHVEFEPSSYYAAFSCELEASAYPMWSILSHMKDSSHADLAKNIMNVCISYLQDWLDAINCYELKIKKQELMHASFHLPLHRYLAAFTCQAMKTMGISLKAILPPANMLSQLMLHPLRVQSLFYEVLSGIWVRNGLQIKGQAMTYIQANFCNSMVDMDLFFLQLCATNLPPQVFLQTAIQVFGVSEWLGMGPLTSPQEIEQDTMLEGLLTLLATLVTSRTNLGNDEEYQCKIEISALLATGDRTHSQLLELMPERSGNAHTRNFENLLKKLATFRTPPLGTDNLEHGLFIPVPEVWEQFYDPLHVLLRAVHRRDFQNSMDRFGEYVKSRKKMPKSGNLWPPFRLPKPIDEKKTGLSDPGCILNNKVMHAALLGIFYRAVHTHNVSEHLLALAVFLLEIAVTSNKEQASNESNNIVERLPRQSNCSGSDDSGMEGNLDNNTEFKKYREVPELLDCYPTHCLSENLRTIVHRISMPLQEPDIAPVNYNTATFDSDYEWEVSDSDTLPMLVANQTNPASASMELMLPQDLSIIQREQQLVRLVNPNSGSNSVVSEDVSMMDAPTNRHLALPSSTSGMEIALRREMGLSAVPSSSATTPPGATLDNGMMLPFQRVQPVAVPSRSLDMVPTTNSISGTTTVAGAVSGSTSGTPRLSYKKKQLNCGAITGPGAKTTDNDSIVIDESILSLLLKLHSQLSGTLDSFSLDDDEDMVENSGDVEMEENSSQNRAESRIGDGPYFIGKLLRKIAEMDENCARNIDEIRRKVWPNQRERQAEQRSRELKEKEDRSKRAKERQAKLMQEFANRQKQFMAMATENMDCGDEIVDDEIEQPREKEYDCIICNQTSPSTENDPMCLVVLVESSSVVGHRQRSKERKALPLSDGDMIRNRHAFMAQDFNTRIELLTEKFGEKSWFNNHNTGWEGGVHVQSCGHHVHLQCQEAYLTSLSSSSRQQNFSVEKGEFLCPVCRQLSNCILPLFPQLDRPTQLIRATVQPYPDLVTEIKALIMETFGPPKLSKLILANRNAMSIMTKTAQVRGTTGVNSLKQILPHPMSIARINLESEVIQRGGSLCSNGQIRYKPKSIQIVPLMNVLSIQMRTQSAYSMYEWISWAQLSGQRVEVDLNCQEMQGVPMLLADPTALMLKFVLLSPLNLDQAYFATIVKATYNLLYYQIVVQLAATLNDNQCQAIVEKFSTATTISKIGVANLGSAMALVLKEMDNCRGLRKDGPLSIDKWTESTINLLEQKLQCLCLPFLRIAALLRHHLYHEELPEIASPHLEFVRLVYYLDLVGSSMDWNEFNGAKGLCFIPEMETELPKTWCLELQASNPKYKLVLNQHVSWQQPRLLSLPREYEKLFTYYHEQICQQCRMVPIEASICLLCGTVVCLKQHCCKTVGGCEAVRHSNSCGGGTGIFLVVTSTYIIVIRDLRACLWGSLYLDDYYEEDRDLKRGKPLYLSEDRFNLLESQWLSHRFAYTKHTWVWHRNSL